MEAAREREREQAQAEQPKAAHAVAAAVPRGPTSAAGVMALQRLVGNAAVVDMIGGEPRVPAAGDPQAGPGPNVAAGAQAPPPAGAIAPAPAPAAAGAAAPAPAPAQGAGGAAAAEAPQPAAAAAAAPEAAAGGGGAAAHAEATGATEAERMEPADDPNFAAMKQNAHAAATQVRNHEPAPAGASAAQAAAVPPGNDLVSQAAGAQVEEMGAQQPGDFDRAAFMAAVRKSIDAAAPKNLEDADDFKSSGKAAKVKDEVGAQLKTGKKGAEKDIRDAAVAPPDTSKATPKEVTALPAEQPGQPPAPVGAGDAMPLPRPAADTDLSQGPKDVDAEMAESELTEEQLQESNEPDFAGALEARRQVGEHAEQGPAQYRAQEQEVLGQARDDAEGLTAGQLKGMHGDKVKALAKVAGHKGVTKAADEAKRAKVATEIQAIYDRTKIDVTKTLDAIDPKVEAAFTRGEEAARKQFEDEVGAKMDAYKDDRYSGWFGWARWLDDKLTGMPGEVNAFYTEGRATYVTRMDAVIGEIADIVGQGLTDARMRIADGRAEVHAYVVQLPQDLKQVGKEAEDKLDAQFEELEGDIDAKQGELVDSLAQKYLQARDALDSRIEELKQANKGYIEKAIDAVKGVAKAIWRLKDLLFSVLAKAVSVITDIVAHPIDFVRNLGASFKAGFEAFGSKIVDYLKETLISWLFGTLETAGITLPKTWDLAGVFELVANLLGLGYASIRERLARALPEGAMDKLESTVGVFQKLRDKGLAGIWEMVETQIGNFEEVVLGPLKDFVVERLIRAGIPTLLAMLNPATAFIRACIAIYDFIRFLLDKGSEIVEFIDRMLDSVSAIAQGDISGAAAHIENTLKSGLKLAISLLASVLRLGGLPEKIREIVETVRKPVRKAVDTVIMGAVKGAKSLLGRPGAYAKEKYGAVKAKVLGGDDTPEGKKQRLDAGMRTALRAVNALPGRFASSATLSALLAPIRLRYGMTKLVPVQQGEHWAVKGVVNPDDEETTNKDVTPTEKTDAPATTEPGATPTEPGATPAEPAAAPDPQTARAVARVRMSVAARIKNVKAQIAELSSGRKTSQRLERIGEDAAPIRARIEALQVLVDADMGAADLAKTTTEQQAKEIGRRWDGHGRAADAIEDTIDAFRDPKKARGLAGEIAGSVGQARETMAGAAAQELLKEDAGERLWKLAAACRPMDIALNAPEDTFLEWKEKLPERSAADLVRMKSAALRLDGMVAKLKEDLGGEGKPKMTMRAPSVREEREKFRLVNPGDHFPQELCDVIDRAQTTVQENNQDTASYGDGSTAYAAIAETVYGKRPLAKLDPMMHIIKTNDLVKAYPGQIAEIESLVKATKTNPQLLERALKLLRAELAKVQSAARFMTNYEKSKDEPYPDWAEQFREELDGFKRAAPVKTAT